MNPGKRNKKTGRKHSGITHSPEEKRNAAGKRGRDNYGKNTDSENTTDRNTITADTVTEAVCVPGTNYGCTRKENANAGKPKHRLNSCIPPGPLKDKWNHLASHLPQLTPEKRNISNIIVAGGGLAACATAAALAEQGYNVRVITRLESPRRESTSYLRGGLNASRNYANDGDSDERFFRDTMEYGGWRSREADVYRMVQLSGRVLDICTALGVPFIREDGGLLLPRPYPGGTTSRSFQARGQTGRQLLNAFHSALMRQTARGKAVIYGRREMTELVICGGQARGLITRNILNGSFEAWTADAIILACGGYSDIYNSVPTPVNGGINPLWTAYRAGAGFANPCFSLTLNGNNSRWQTVPEYYNASQRCSGGLWTDYLLRTTIPGLFAAGESNFSVHGADCMPGNAPLQELADGLFIIPATLGAYLAEVQPRPVNEKHPAFEKAMKHAVGKKNRLLNIKGRVPPEEFHRRLAGLMRERAGFIRYSYRLQQGLRELRQLREEFYNNVLVPDINCCNTAYETALKTSVYLDFGEILIKDAILRRETCGAHFRMDYSTDGNISKPDEEANVRVWFREENRWHKNTPYREGLDIPVSEPLKFTVRKVYSGKDYVRSRASAGGGHGRNR
ncbi:MAG: FAD-binding protein [Elusimicrobiales bacterium]|nr:FAD-binding protein [Elusimicrobiales bacterium]